MVELYNVTRSTDSVFYLDCAVRAGGHDLALRLAGHPHRAAAGVGIVSSRGGYLHLYTGATCPCSRSTTAAGPGPALVSHQPRPPLWQPPATMCHLGYYIYNNFSIVLLKIYCILNWPLGVVADAGETGGAPELAGVLGGVLHAVHVAAVVPRPQGDCRDKTVTTNHYRTP